MERTSYVQRSTPGDESARHAMIQHTRTISCRTGGALVELQADLFSRHVCPLEGGAAFCCTVDEKSGSGHLTLNICHEKSSFALAFPQ